MDTYKINRMAVRIKVQFFEGQIMIFSKETTFSYGTNECFQCFLLENSSILQVLFKTTVFC